MDEVRKTNPNRPGATRKLSIDICGGDRVDQVGESIGDRPPSGHVGRASCEVDQDGRRLVDWNSLRSDRREIRSEDHHAGGAAQSVRNLLAAGDGNLEAVWRAIAEPLRRER